MWNTSAGKNRIKIDRDQSGAKYSKKNAIDLYNQTIKILQVQTTYLFVIKIKKITNNSSSPDVFDEVYAQVIDYLEQDVYPRFMKSNLYRLYIQLKSQEQSQVNENDFVVLRVLGRGAFGFVYAVIKKILKNDSIDTIMAERDFLAAMHSQFVTGLKY
ncbi:hypothetical protein RFI_14366, partial [Reticulomyxa filosa]